MSGTSTSVERERPQAQSILRPWIFVFGVALLLAVCCTVYFAWGRNSVSTDDAQVDGRLVPVAPKVSGYISELLVDDNQTVVKGQVVARIDPRDLQTVVTQAEAALSGAEARASSSSSDVSLTSTTTDTSVVAAQADLSAAQAQLAQTRKAADKAHHADTSFALANVADRKANYERAHSDLTRMHVLVERHEISQLQFDAYLANERMAKSQLDAAQQSLSAQNDAAEIADQAVEGELSKVQLATARLLEAKANRRRVGIRNYDATALRTAVDAAKANLERAKLDLSYTDILAPQDGVVTHRTVEKGVYVSPGQTLLTIVPTQDVWVTANFKETQLRNLRRGDRADITVDRLSTTFHGNVESIANATGSRLSLLPPENATGNFVKIVQRVPVKILFDSSALKSHSLVVGENVGVTVHKH